MTLEELVVAVQRHREHMAPLAHGWAGAVGDDAIGQLVGLLVVSDRRLGDLCCQLSQHIARLERQETNENATVQEGRRHGPERRSYPSGRWA